MTLPSGQWTWRLPRAIGAEVLTAVLERVAGPAQVLNAVVERDHPRDFLPHFRPGFAGEQVRAFRMNSGGDFAQDFPFRSRFANLPRDFRAEHDAAFRARLSAAVILFVTGFGRKQ